MKRVLAVLLVPSLMLVLATTASAGIDFKLKVEVDLDGGQETSPVTTDMTGEFAVKITNNRFKFKLEVEDNSKNIGAAHLHCGAPDTDGPVGVTLFGGSFTDDHGTVAKGKLTAPNPGNGCGWANLADVAAAVQAGNTYVNVHTNIAPGGEIRGNLG